jgi:hypothetical protein
MRFSVDEDIVPWFQRFSGPESRSVMGATISLVGNVFEFCYDVDPFIIHIIEFDGIVGDGFVLVIGSGDREIGEGLEDFSISGTGLPVGAE